ncbi:hypothetical protein [Rossellomorea aquimaris]|uniref:hypothetical protein n=1 Tax=Rossellomorea aquimaris TaxID=189382 RepID=UPI0011E93D52|nr:hypothetical protein [Rossellomorea aquimaris]TYS86282.1 hypothetical protein FZC88_19360 [Rossellomorea aquimaris]
MYRNRDRLVNIVIVLLFCILIFHIIRIILHVKVYFVYSMGLGYLLFIGLIIFLIMFLYLKK